MKENLGYITYMKEKYLSKHLKIKIFNLFFHSFIYQIFIEHLLYAIHMLSDRDTDIFKNFS